jgi:hypothetical protein
MPQVSVIVLNWNGKHLLSECLTALAHQTFEDFEVLLVDNGSTDDSVAFAQKHFPNVRLCALKENLGFTGGNNFGFREARGRYIALLNNDTAVTPGWLEALVKALESHPEVGFCASKLVFYDDHNCIDTAGDYFSIAGAGSKIGHLDRADKREYTEPSFVFGACAGAAIYRKNMLDEIGLLDDDFFLSFEDADLSFRAQLKGYRCLYVPEALVYHKVHATIQKNSPFYVYYGHRNLEFVYVKNMPSRLIAKYFFLHVLDDLISFVFFVGQGRALDYLRAKWHAFRALPKLLQKRRLIQSQRTVSVAYIDSLLMRNWLGLKRERWQRMHRRR